MDVPIGVVSAEKSPERVSRDGESPPSSPRKRGEEGGDNLYFTFFRASRIGALSGWVGSSNTLAQTIFPSLSTTKTARSEIPGRGSPVLKTPNFCATSPCGKKSDRSGYESPPKCFPNAMFVGTLSQLMPTTWALRSANRARSAWNAVSSACQTGVKAAGKNAMTTFFFPR